MISRDDFNTWRANPVSQWVFSGLEMIGEHQRTHWMETSWDQGACSPELLLQLKTRADTARAVFEVEYDRLCEVLGEEPQG